MTRCFVTFAGLTKEYKNSTGGSKLAVDSLDLTMYSGQITALLGHNGAGKVGNVLGFLCCCFFSFWISRFPGWIIGHNSNYSSF